MKWECPTKRAEIHQVLLLQFPLLADFLLVKFSVKEQDRKIITLVNLGSGSNKMVAVLRSPFFSIRFKTII